VQVDGGAEYLLSGICQACTPMEDLDVKPRDDLESIVYARDILKLEMSDEEMAVIENFVKKARDAFDRDMLMLETSDEKIMSYETSDEETISDNLENDLSEYTLALTVPDDISILDGPDIWLADSGTTVRSTPYNIGFIELQ